MIWIFGERVQSADALLFDRRPQSSDLLAQFKTKPRAFLDCDYAFGEDWAAVFATPIDGEAMLPNLSGSQPLYKAYDRIYLPVGVTLGMGPTAASDYLQVLLETHAPLHQDVIILPADNKDHPKDHPEADLYIIEERLPVGLIIPRDAA